RANFDDEVADLRLRHLGAHHVPAVPAVARIKAEDLTAPSRHQRIDLRRRLARADDLNQMDRLEQHRLALRQTFDNPDAAGGAKRHVGGVDRVRRAVDQRHVKIDHWKTEWAVLESVDDAFLDRRNVVARHHAAGDLVLERKARAARHRLDVDDHVAVLAVAARLLLVTAALDDALADGFPVADARLAPLDRDAVTVAQSLGGDAQMHLALAPQYHLVRFRIVHDGDRGIFLGELAEGLTQFHVVLALLRRYGDGQHRRIGLDLGDRRMGLLARRQRVAGLGFIEFGEGNGLADVGRSALLAVLSDELEEAGNTAGLAVAGL